VDIEMAIKDSEHDWRIREVPAEIKEEEEVRQENIQPEECKF
jgi:hypothetical protein